MTVRVHALPKVVVPVAVPPADESVKFAALLKNATVVSILASPGLNTAPLEKVNDRLFRSLAMAVSMSSEHLRRLMAPASAISATKPRMILLAHCTLFPPYLVYERLDSHLLLC
jgi:hypothetical protein